MINLFIFYPCLWKICKANGPFICVRWVFIYAVLGFTGYHSYYKQEAWEQEFIIGSLAPMTTRFHYYLLIYCL